jgi:hypothetical protein
MGKLRYTLTIYALGLTVLPAYFAWQVVTGNWSPRRVNLGKFWEALIR